MTIHGSHGARESRCEKRIAARPRLRPALASIIEAPIIKASVIAASIIGAPIIKAPIIAVSILAATVPFAAQAQSLADRVLGAPTAAVRMSYAAREDVCGDGARSSRIGGWSDGNWRHVCEPGPVRVQLGVDAGRIVAIRTYVGGAWRPRADVTDLGDVPAEEASEFLLGLAATGPGPVAEDAIAPAVMADAPDPWPRLLELAQDRSLRERVRESAVFWLGQSAAREATRGLADIVDSEAEKTAMQRAAVFALSQREDDPERIDHLVRIARTHPNEQVIRAAFFWLADSADDRAIALFEEVLSAQGGADDALTPPDRR